MNSLVVDLKLLIKRIVTNSDILSAIRRNYSMLETDLYFKKIQRNYYNTSFSDKIKKYKNTHVGERCFVLGNGPSLKAEDLEWIKDEYSFAANRVYLIFDKTDWRPSFWICQDRQLIRSLTDFYQSYDGDIFLGYQALHDFGINVPKANYYLCNARQVIRRKTQLDFSAEADKYIIDGASVTYSAIQMAVYMGFSEIYLLGMDHQFSHTLDKNRRIVAHKDVKIDYFDNRYKDAFKKFEEKGKTYAAPDSEMITYAFEAAKRYCDDHGVEIFNATRGGKLEVFTRVDFDDIVEVRK